MRVRIVFQVKNKGAHVPFHHQYLLAQTIRGILVKGGNKTFLNFSEYNFSGLKGQTKISRKGLHFFSSRVTLVFSTSNGDFLDYFTAQLMDTQELMIGNLVIAPEKIEPEPAVTLSETGKYLCISPMVLLPGVFNEEAGKRFISPESNEFSDLLYESTISRMDASGRFSPAELAACYKFQIVPDKDYLTRIEINQKKFARIYPMFDSDIRYEVRGYTFPFTLYADALVQQYVFENGIGQLVHKGFGMIDVAGQSQINADNDRAFQYA